MHFKIKRQSLDKKNSIDTAVILTVVCNLSPSAPNDLASGCDKTEFRDVDLDDGSLCEDTELCVPGDDISIGVWV